VSTAIVDGNSRRWKAGVSERTNGNAHRLIVAFFRVENRRPTDWAEPEYELGSPIPDTSVFSGRSEDHVVTGESGQRRENAARPLLAGQAVANANASWLTFDLNAQLPARASGCSGTH
jgi:hypothetical protein